MGAHIPRNWEAAPELVAQEIFLVWEEDEMPEELKQSPGYVPFTLSPEAQAWVDSMAEIKDFQDGKVRRVIGYPRPPERSRRQLSSGPPPPAYSSRAAPETPTPLPTAPRPIPPEPPREPPRVMPDIAPGRAAPLPDQPTSGKPARAPMESETVPPAPAESPPRGMPEIGGPRQVEPTESREKPRTMPEIGTGAHEPDDTRDEPRPMPEIG